MFARVITAHPDADQLEAMVRHARQELPGIRDRSGYRGYDFLIGDAAHSAVVISYWDTREQMEAVAAGTAGGIHDDGTSREGLRGADLEQYVVEIHDR